jgi:hypothetical protein
MIVRGCWSLLFAAHGAAACHGTAPSILPSQRTLTQIRTRSRGGQHYAPCLRCWRVSPASRPSSTRICSRSFLVRWAACKISVWMQSTGERKPALQTRSFAKLLTNCIQPFSRFAQLSPRRRNHSMSQRPTSKCVRNLATTPCRSLSLSR